MSRIAFIGVLLAVAVVQPLLPFDVPLLCALAATCAVYLDRRNALCVAAVAGLLFDLSASGPIGLSTALLMAAVEGILRVRAQIYSDRILALALLGGWTVGVHRVGRMLWFAAVRLRPVSLSDWILHPGVLMLMGALCTPFIAWLLAPLLSRVMQRRPY